MDEGQISGRRVRRRLGTAAIGLLLIALSAGCGTGRASRKAPADRSEGAEAATAPPKRKDEGLSRGARGGTGVPPVIFFFPLPAKEHPRSSSSSSPRRTTL